MKNVNRALALALIVPVSIALFPRRANATPAVAAPAAVACLSNPVCALGVVIIGGVLYFQMTHNGSTTTEVAMIDDPEAVTEDWSEDIVAMNESLATAKCRALAEAYTRQGGTRVSARRAVPIGRSGRAFRCNFQAEV